MIDLDCIIDLGDEFLSSPDRNSVNNCQEKIERDATGNEYDSPKLVE